MFEIRKQDGTLLGRTEKPNYIYLQKNGVFGLTNEENAQGIAYQGTPYQLMNRPLMYFTEDENGIRLPAVNNPEGAILIEIDTAHLLQSNETLSNMLFVKAAEAEVFDEQTIVEHAHRFTSWDENFTGTRETIVYHDGVLYKLIHDVIVPEENAEPGTVKGGPLWRPLGAPNDPTPPWSRPILPSDGYDLGDSVTHNDKVWQVTQVGGDGKNVWEPGVYGWEVVVEE